MNRTYASIKRGLEQARRLAGRLARERIAAVYSSDLGRALRTAELVAEPHRLPVIPHPGLREVHTGHWTGLDRAEVAAVPEWADLLEVYRARPSAHRMPGGENAAEVQQRGLATVREVAARYEGQSVVLISHNLPHVFAVADRVHVQRLGKRATIVDPRTTGMSDAVAIMTGATEAQSAT